MAGMTVSKCSWSTLRTSPPSDIFITATNRFLMSCGKKRKVGNDQIMWQSSWCCWKLDGDGGCRRWQLYENLVFHKDNNLLLVYLSILTGWRIVRSGHVTNASGSFRVKTVRSPSKRRILSIQIIRLNQTVTNGILDSYLYCSFLFVVFFSKFFGHDFHNDSLQMNARR